MPAALRIIQRHLTLDQVEAVPQDEQPFPCFHDGQWKTGYYEPNAGLFVGKVNGVKPQYIQNLQATQP